MKGNVDSPNSESIKDTNRLGNNNFCGAKRPRQSQRVAANALKEEEKRRKAAKMREGREETKTKRQTWRLKALDEEFPIPKEYKDLFDSFCSFMSELVDGTTGKKKKKTRGAKMKQANRREVKSKMMED